MTQNGDGANADTFTVGALEPVSQTKVSLQKMTRKPPAILKIEYTSNRNLPSPVSSFSSENQILFKP